MASQINIYWQLSISTIRIADINNLNCWYRYLIVDICNYCRYQQLKLLISTIRIADIYNSNCWYPQFKRLISTILSNLLTSTIRIVDINHWNYGYRQLLISTLRIVDISNSNCRYQHCECCQGTGENMLFIWWPRGLVLDWRQRCSFSPP